MPSLDPEKARRAAKHPARPGDDCRGEPGHLVPRIDRNKCEGKRDCLDVCPYQVFEIRHIEARDLRGLSLKGRLKSLVHGGLSAYTPRAHVCQACGLCVVACPEGAIRLVPSRPENDLSRG